MVDVQNREAVVHTIAGGPENLEIKSITGPGRCTEAQYEAAMDFHIKNPAVAIMVNPFFKHPSNGRFSVNYAFLAPDGRIHSIWVSPEGVVTNHAASAIVYQNEAQEIEDKYGLFFG